MKDVISFSDALGEIYSLVEQTPDTEELLQKACEHIVQRTGATIAYIAILDDSFSQQPNKIAAAGPDRTHISSIEISADINEPGGNGIFGHVYRNCEPFVTQDISSDPRLVPFVRAHPDLRTASAAGIPICRDSQCQGVLVVATNHIGHFNDVIMSLLQRIAQILAIGMDRTEARTLYSRYQSLYSVLLDVNETIARGLEPHHLFRETVQIVARVSSKLRAYVAEVKPETDQIFLVACAGTGLDEALTSDIMRTPLSTRSSDPMGLSISGVTYRARRAVVWPNVMDDNKVPIKRKLEKLDPPRSMVGIPIFLNGRCIAVLILAATEPNYFSDNVVTLSKRLGANIGLAIKAHAQKEELRRQSLTDHLTGLPNRMLFMDRAYVAIARAERSGEQVAVVTIDVDHFNTVNNRFGHSTGNDILKKIADRLSSRLRKSDTVARLDSDKFAALILSKNNTDHIDRTIMRLQKAVNTAVKFDGESVSLHASIGVAIYPRDGRHPENLLRRADMAMYRIKQQGGNRWGMFEEDLEKQIMLRHKLGERFKAALAKGHIVFHYQPIVDLNAGNVVGAEALVRWNDPGRGLVPPGDWIGVVEEDLLLISLLGRHVLEAVMHRLRSWHTNGERLWISVNIGVRHLLSRDFMADLRKALALAPELTSYLNIELTETALIEDLQHVANVLNEIRTLGVHVALDDFGTGQASLTYLQELPADRIKIDVRFVLQMLQDVRALGIVAAATQGAWTMGLGAVAEGVETEEHGRRLKQMGCLYAQGFAIAPALPADEFAHWLEQWRAPASWQRRNDKVLTHSEVRLLASTVQHGARHRVIVENSGNTMTSQTIPDRMRRQFPCPLPHSAYWPSGNERDSQLQEIHHHLHRLEHACVTQLAQCSTVPEKLLDQAKSQLREYERAVESLLYTTGI